MVEHLLHIYLSYCDSSPCSLTALVGQEFLAVHPLISLAYKN
ncbi:rCG48220, partial [Rattus norvegicus]